VLGAHRLVGRPIVRLALTRPLRR